MNSARPEELQPPGVGGPSLFVPSIPDLCIFHVSRPCVTGNDVVPRLLSVLSPRGTRRSCLSLWVGTPTFASCELYAGVYDAVGFCMDVVTFGNKWVVSSKWMPRNVWFVLQGNRHVGKYSIGHSLSPGVPWHFYEHGGPSGSELNSGKYNPMLCYFMSGAQEAQRWTR